MNPVAFGVFGVIVGLAASALLVLVVTDNLRLRRRLRITNLTVVALKRGKPDNFDRNIRRLFTEEGQ